MTAVTYSGADARDSKDICALLQECGLPNQDIGAHLPDFITARAGGQLAAVIGLQVCGHAGLLRSLAVAPSYRGQGLAHALVARILAHAHTRKITSLYLLTTTAERFFSKLGFLQIDRGAVPPEVLATEEFRTLCPDSAVCMMRNISQDAR